MVACREDARETHETLHLLLPLVEIMIYLPALYIAELFDRAPDSGCDGMTLDALSKLLDLLEAAEVQSPSAPSLVGANILNKAGAPSVLMMLGDCHLPSISAWINLLNSKGLSSIIACSYAHIEGASDLNTDDAPILIGHGVALASRGLSGRPLVGMPLAELRAELTESQQKLSAIAGYQVGILAPTVSTFGQAVDGLVLEEARRAGYRLILEPGGRVTELSSDATPINPEQLDYRIVSTDDSPKSLADWVIGAGLSRQSAQLRELLRRPRRILSRLKSS